MTPEQEFHKNFNQNVKFLESTRRNINIRINDSLRKGDNHNLKIYTNLYLLTYTSWTEALLVKLVHTPSGFNESEKKNILRKKSIIDKWEKCINLSFKKFQKSGSEIPNKKKKIKSLIKEYTQTQTNIRNKIAHGQWIYPLYSNNLKHDPEIKIFMESIDVIQIDTWFEIFKEISEIVRGLIDSREKNNHLAHYNQYFQKLVNIQKVIESRKKWSLEEKKEKLNLKPRIGSSKLPN